MKKIMSLFLSLVLAMTTCFAYAGSVYADEIDFGNGIHGVYDSKTATLTVSGDTEGVEMPDFDISKTYDNIDDIKTIKVESEIARIGAYAFYNCTNLKSVLVYNNSCAIANNALPDDKSITIYGQEGSVVNEYATENKYNFKRLFSVTFISFTNEHISSEFYPEDTPIDDIPSPEFSTEIVPPEAVDAYGIYKHVKSRNIWKPSKFMNTLTDSLTYQEMSISEKCSFDETVVQPTETEGGYTLHECTVCKFTYKDSETEPITTTTTTTTAPTEARPTTVTVTAAPTTAYSEQPTSKISTTAASVKKPSKTSISKLTKDKKSFKVAWKKISSVSGYEIQYSTDKSFKKNKKTVTVSGNKAKNPSKTIKSLKSKKTYYVRVRAYKNVKVNGKVTKVYSSWSKVKSVKTK